VTRKLLGVFDVFVRRFTCIILKWAESQDRLSLMPHSEKTFNNNEKKPIWITVPIQDNWFINSEGRAVLVGTQTVMIIQN
jgi:hypothetical protein